MPMAERGSCFPAEREYLPSFSPSCISWSVIKKRWICFSRRMVKTRAVLRRVSLNLRVFFHLSVHRLKLKIDSQTAQRPQIFFQFGGRPFAQFVDRFGSDFICGYSHD